MRNALRTTQRNSNGIPLNMRRVENRNNNVSLNLTNTFLSSHVLALNVTRLPAPLKLKFLLESHKEIESVYCSSLVLLLLLLLLPLLCCTFALYVNIQCYVIAFNSVFHFVQSIEETSKMVKVNHPTVLSLSLSPPISSLKF